MQDQIQTATPVLPTTSELFKKHFGETPAVGITHPNFESFFDELAQVCIEEDKQKALTANLTNSEIYHDYSNSLQEAMQDSVLSTGEYIEFSHLENIEL